MITPALSVRGLHHHYGMRQALDDVSFEVATGGLTALLGPNGAGKTTLFSIFTRLLRCGSGTVQVFGNDLSLEPRRALGRMGVVFQQPTLDLDLTVVQNLHYHGAIQGLARSTVRQRAQAELERLDVWERRDERVRSLNGGHRRRVEIARALLHEPDLLLMDEASAGLDLETRTRLFDYVRGLCADRGLTVLWATHLVEELNTGDQAVLLERGRIKGADTLQALVTDAGVGDPTELVLTMESTR